MRRQSTYIILAMLTLLLGTLYFYYGVLTPYAYQTTGFAAKTYCSARYVSGRGALSILSQEMGRPEMEWIAMHEDTRRKIVTAHLTLLAGHAEDEHDDGAFSRTAVYRPGLGCTLALGISPRKLKINELDSPNIHTPMPWRENPLYIPARIQKGAQKWVEQEFARKVGTRALLVWHRGYLVGEAYSAEMTHTTPLLGWSMTKSVIHALYGIAVQQGWISIEDNNLLPAWQDDERRHITIDDLLRMSSGLRFDETYDIGHDPVIMLYASPAAAAYAAAMPADYEAGKHWAYSSGTTNILAHILKLKVREKTGLSLSQFAYRYLFDPLGTYAFTIEPDVAGDLIGSSFGWATAREWLRFALLYMQDGLWDGERIFPAGWGDYAASYTPGSNGKYGAHFWVNNVGEAGTLPMPSLPADLYHASGFEGQDVVIVPSEHLVVVRLGFTPNEADWSLETHLSPLLPILNKSK